MRRQLLPTVAGIVDRIRGVSGDGGKIDPRALPSVPPATSTATSAGRSSTSFVESETLPIAPECETRRVTVEDPFLDATGLGERPDDPLRPVVTTVEISAIGDEGAYGLSYDGTVREKPTDATDYPLSGRVHGCLDSGGAVTIVIDGTLEWLDTTAGMDTSVTIDDPDTAETSRRWNAARPEIGSRVRARIDVIGDVLCRSRRDSRLEGG